MISIDRLVGGLLIIVAVIVRSTVAFEETNEYTNKTKEYQRAIERKHCLTNTGFSGTCMTKVVCNRNGGTESGDCQGFGICCEISLQCGGETNLKRTLIETPTNRAPRCSYTFKPYSSNICQIKIEMEELRLQQPTTGYTTQCTDNFEVNEMTFCGNNDGQHLYVPFDVSGGTDANVNLVFNLANLDSVSQWRLIVTQLECPDSLNALENNDDLKMLAPIGCTQYFTERSGTFESFNYNSGAGPYMPNLNYAICFERQIGDSTIQFSFIDFGLPNQLVNNGYDNDCHPLIITPGKPDDYLTIPRSVISGTLQPTYFCGTDKAGIMVTSSGAGPFVIYFNSDQDWSEEERGFQISYNIIKDRYIIN